MATAPKLLKIADTLNAEKIVSVIVIGAGNRGSTYAKFALDFPEKVQIKGVADPRRFYRDVLKNDHKIQDDYIFEDWKDAANKPKFADCVFICTPDKLHKEPAVAFANKGYHILLEKPMAVTADDCEQIVNTCKKNNVMLEVCHVLRYTPQSQKIKEIIDSGRIGDLVNIQLLDPVGYWHFAHSFVRGRWRNSGESCFSLLAKCCHDIDLISYWSAPKKFSKISSFGSLKHFTPSNKPTGAASRCFDCSVEDACPYSAKKIYLDAIKTGYSGYPERRVSDLTDIESVTEALKTGPYGRCVYECDNDVCDNQVVNIQFDDGATASFTMIAFTEKVGQRQVKVFGTEGEVECDFTHMKVTELSFVSGNTTVHNLAKDVTQDSQSSSLTGNGGADFYAVQAFIMAVMNDDPSKIITGPEASLLSHKLCFMAEQSRLTNSVLQIS